MSEQIPLASPTPVRWWVLAVATLSSLLLYLDRICVSFAVESIRGEFQATQEQMGWFLGAFFWSYALGQVPAGWLSDRFGTRVMLTLYILGWSLFTALLGLSTGITSLLAYRLGCGLAQAGAYPSCAKAVRDWMPLVQRGRASSVVALGGRIGGAVAPVLTGAVMLWIAQSGRDARFTADEILDPEQAIRYLDFSPETLGPSTTSLRWEEASEAPASRARLSVTPPVLSQEMAATYLNDVQPLAILAQDPHLTSLALPPDLRRRVERYQGQAVVLSEHELRLANRQFWEAALPRSVKKLEARGWRQTLVIYGCVGIFVALLFWGIFRDQPEQHPWTNVAEVAWIGNTSPAGVASAVAHEPFPWNAMLTSVGLWGNCLCQLLTNVGWVFLVTWLPRYLDEVHKIPVLERGFMASVPIFAGLIGMLAGGPWTDRLTAVWGLRWGRRIPIASSRLLAAAGYGVCLIVSAGVFGELGTRTPAWIAIAGLALVAISTDLGVAATWAYAQDVAGKQTAAVLGWANMWGNFGAALAPPLSGMLLGEQASLGSWNLLFVFCAGAFVLSAFGGWLMDSSRPLVAR